MIYEFSNNCKIFVIGKKIGYALIFCRLIVNRLRMKTLAMTTFIIIF